MLITQGTRDEIYYYAAINKEKRMHSAIESLKAEIDKKKGTNQKTLF